MALNTEYLSSKKHDRDAAGLTYVYPVVSRRAGGVSIGINLNPNNACNWRCVYCQVPELTRGHAPEIDLQLLEQELAGFLQQVLHGSFMQEHVPPECRQLCDIAISGNGEPTSCRRFDEVVRLVIRLMESFGIIDSVKLRLITNGSYVQKPYVQASLAAMGDVNGEVWFKVDAVDVDAVERINGVRFDAEQLRKRLEMAAGLCPLWLQTCMFVWKGEEPDVEDVNAYLQFLAALKQRGTAVKGVLLYGPARQPMLEEGAFVSPLPQAWMQHFADRIAAQGFEVRLSL